MFPVDPSLGGALGQRRARPRDPGIGEERAVQQVPRPSCPSNPYLCLARLGPDDSAQKRGEPSLGLPRARPRQLAQAAALQRNKNTSTIFNFFKQEKEGIKNSTPLGSH